MVSTPAIPMTVALFAVGVAAITDVWKYKVHNLLTVPLLLSGLVYHGLTGGWQGFLASVFGSLAGFVLLAGFYVLGGIGAGDVKLMAALGAWLGVMATVGLFVVGSLAAGIYALVLVLIYDQVKETWYNFQVVCRRLAILGRCLVSDDAGVDTGVNSPYHRRRLVPYAAMMGVALLVLLAWHWLQGSS